MASGIGINITFDLSPVLRDIKGRFASLRDGAALDFVRMRLSLAAYRALATAQRYAPKDTGAFANGLGLVNYGENGFAIISDNPKLLEWLRSGTGIYGSRGERIVPTNARALVFSQWRAAAMAPNFRGAYAFASVRGMAANPWEQSALEAIQADVLGELPKVALDWTAYAGIGTAQGVNF